MQIVLHQTDQKVADFESIVGYLSQLITDLESKSQKSEDFQLHVLPELFLCGYPTQDLCLQKNFTQKYIQSLDTIQRILNRAKSNNWQILAGGLSYDFDDHGIPLKIQNSAFSFKAQSQIEAVYHKMLLPNYDIFDEKKYFTKGEVLGIIEIQDKKFALLICEDMWPSSTHSINPIIELINDKTELDGVINLSASPFHLGKERSRIVRASEISQQLNCPFFYCNKVGGEDEILFDGASFVVNNKEVLTQAKFFQADQIEISLPEKPLKQQVIIEKTENTWENLFSVRLNTEGKTPLIKTLTDDQCQYLIAASTFGIREYARKTGFKKLLVALSGGLDSTVVLTLCKLGLGNEYDIEAVYMPGQYSAGMSYDLSAQLCKNLGIPLKVFSIKFIHSALRNAYRDTFKEELNDTLADENIQSRIRGLMIYTHSNMSGAMVLNTSNKSEISVGYSTQYGDSVGAISPLGDLFKSEVFDLANYINRNFENCIPQGIIDRPPSAELRENQTDNQSLPDYDRLDAMLECFLSYRYSKEEMIEMGFDGDEVNKIYQLIQKSEYKRYQFCPIIKLKSKSFGFGYRVPISKYF